MTAGRRLLTAVAGLAAAGLAWAACGSSGPSGTASAGPGTGSTTTGPSTTAGSATPAGGGGLTLVTSGLPEVSNAGDLSAEPVPAAGHAPAPTRLEGRDLVVGSGTAAAATSSVKVQYVGANYADGKVFDASWTRGAAATFPLNGVIPGFAQGIVGMKVGGRREIVIPPALGYGAQGQPPAVGPGETLVFVIDLLAVQ